MSRLYAFLPSDRHTLTFSGFQAAVEVHPAHAFLSLPDRPFPLAEPSRSNDYGSYRGNSESRVAPMPKPLRHPGAFCHKRVVAVEIRFGLANRSPAVYEISLAPVSIVQSVHLGKYLRSCRPICRSLAAGICVSSAKAPERAQMRLAICLSIS